jgi:hypothetical protein
MLENKIEAIDAGSLRTIVNTARRQYVLEVFIPQILKKCQDKAEHSEEQLTGFVEDHEYKHSYGDVKGIPSEYLIAVRDELEKLKFQVYIHYLSADLSDRQMDQKSFIKW